MLGNLVRPVWGWGPGEIPGLHHATSCRAQLTAVSAFCELGYTAKHESCAYKLKLQ